MYISGYHFILETCTIFSQDSEKKYIYTTKSTCTFELIVAWKLCFFHYCVIYIGDYKLNYNFFSLFYLFLLGQKDIVLLKKWISERVNSPV